MGKTTRTGHPMRLHRLGHYLKHRRLPVFWIAAVIGLVAPWLFDLDIPALATGDDLGECTVQSIHDGDTMRVKCGGEQMKIRLYCIDAPELAQKPWGQESRDYLRSITGDRVTIIKHDIDRYGRTVGEVIQDGRNLNLAMVEAGQAAVYRRYCSGSDYLHAETQARQQRIGVWSKTGDQQQPWNWRRSSGVF